MKRKLHWLILGLFFLFLGTVTDQPVRAAETSGTGLNVTAQIPENQIDSSASYLDLKVAPNQTQTLTLKIKNERNQTRKVKVTPVSAYTNANGTVAYQQHVSTTKSNAPYQFSQLVSTGQTLTFAPKETKTVQFKLTVPAEKFSGQILGGFYIIPLNQVQKTKKKGIVINNKFSMLLGANLQEDSSLKTPEIALGKVTPGLLSGTTTIFANLRNNTPTLFGQMKVVAKVSKAGSSKVLHQTTKTNLSMAPSSNFNYAIDWGRTAFQAGKYHLHLVATSGTKKWVFNRNFTITQAKAAKYNKKAVNLKKNYLWLWITLGILLLLLLLALVYYLGRRQGNHQGKHSENE
ncbi:cell surface protein [Lactobacillus selangorensis]|uniref:Cell surface protein n=1 Tax=Lactobacillus selangorensis TaxID=81857 RepID=A0A0R2FRC1_9LACO|nr:DUF916 and DUF3324 domain-containing protein [Lactobacillus selangorensis]KRN28917.1 cell surface protein [Lactobacillus selangorensis]KRN32673.1 cell surface protein [Lactobacillus selangorensis]